MTALQLKEETKIPIRVTTDLLFRMRDVNLLTEITGNGDQEPAFQPAQDIANITVGRMKELLDAYPRDKQRKLDTKIASLLSEEAMSRLKAAKDEYLRALDEIPLKEVTR
jgi:membrane protein